MSKFWTPLSYVRRHGAPCFGFRCSQAFAAFSDMGCLSVGVYDLQPGWRDDMDHGEWLELLRQFTAVEMLWVSAPLTGLVADTLKDVTAGMVAELLPALHFLCLEDEPLRRVGKLIIAHQSPGFPVTIANGPKEFLNIRRSHLRRPA
ncbi:hypothetical protein BJY52DRAFT_1195761 [Lactarius psammicola]|nr:hypothetical protein BJY52DRAFT_1195761 [Lactarius psammicola]